MNHKKPTRDHCGYCALYRPILLGFWTFLVRLWPSVHHFTIYENGFPQGSLFQLQRKRIHLSNNWKTQRDDIARARERLSMTGSIIPEFQWFYAKNDGRLAKVSYSDLKTKTASSQLVHLAWIWQCNKAFLLHCELVLEFRWRHRGGLILPCVCSSCFEGLIFLIHIHLEFKLKLCPTML